jgi:hypothetical protein
VKSQEQRRSWIWGVGGVLNFELQLRGEEGGGPMFTKVFWTRTSNLRTITKEEEPHDEPGLSDDAIDLGDEG